MKASAEELKSAELLERQEMGLSHLYRTFAKKFPDHEAFWTDFSEQESTHALIIRTFRLMLEEGTLDHKVREFDRTKIEAALAKMNDFMTLTMKGGATIEDAVTMAAEFEQSLLEEKIFDEEPGDHEELKKLLKVLKEDTEVHHQSFVEFRAKALAGGQ